MEEHIKEAAADVVARAFGTHQADYLEYKNYQNKKKRKYHFSLPGILDTMKKTLDTDKEPIHHFMESYGEVPPWILFKSIYFSTIANFIDLLKFPEQQVMAERLYSNDNLSLSDSALCRLMTDTLFICMDYRNIAAHGGRIYNYNSARRLRAPYVGAICSIAKIKCQDHLSYVDLRKISLPSENTEHLFSKYKFCKIFSVLYYNSNEKQ